MTDDSVLVERLASASPPDRETLLALEPRYRTPEFIDHLLSRLGSEPVLLPCAYGVLVKAVAEDPSLMRPYVAIALSEANRLHEIGDLAEALDILQGVERVGQRYKSLGATINARLNTVALLVERGEPTLLAQAATSLAALFPEGVDRPERTAATDMASNVLGEAARRIYYETGDVETTARLAEAANRIVTNAPAVLLAGMALMSRGQIERAAKALRTLAEEAPYIGMVQFNLAQCELRLGNTAAGIAAVERACQLNPDEGTYLLGAAGAYCTVGRLSEAANILDRATPLCEKISREDPQRTLLTSNGARLSVKDALAIAQVHVAMSAVRAGDAPLASRVIETLLATGDEVDAAHALVVRSELAAKEGKPEQVLGDLDEAVRRHPSLSMPRKARAAERLRRGDLDGAIEDLGHIVRHSQDAHEAVEPLEKILAQHPSHVRASMWLGAALSFSDAADLDRAIQLLDGVIRQEPDNAYALNRRGLARIQRRTDREDGAMFTFADLTSSLTDLGLAAAGDAGDAEVQHSWRWVVDRVSRHEAVLDWMLAVHDKPGGIEAVSPDAWQAMTTHFEGLRVGRERDHPRAVATMLEAQRQFTAAGLPLMAVRMELELADNLLRMDDVQGALDRLSAFDRAYQRISFRPLTLSLEATADQAFADRADGLVPTVTFQFEYMDLQLMGDDQVMLARNGLGAEAFARTGDLPAALAAAAEIEQHVLARPQLSPQEVSLAVNVLPILRDSGEPARARILLEHVRPHADGRSANALEFTLGTLYTKEGKLDAAIEVYEGLQARVDELPPGIGERVSLNLAGIMVHVDPARALAIVGPHLNDSSHAPRSALRVRIIAAQAARGIGDASQARDHVSAGFRHLIAIRAQMSRYADRVSLIGMLEGLTDQALQILLEAEDADTVLALTEATRERTLAEILDDRHLSDDESVRTADAHVERIRGVHSALMRLLRGVEKYGPSYVDPEALALVRREDARFAIQPDEGEEGLVSPTNLRRTLELTQRLLGEAQRDADRARFDRRRKVPDVVGPAEIREGLRAAAAGLGARVVLATVIASQQEVALVVSAPDCDRAELLRTPLPTAALRDLAGAGTATQLDGPLTSAVTESLIRPLIHATAAGDTVLLSLPPFCARIPFHAYEVDGQRWCARNPIAYVPSGTVLLRCLSAPLADGEHIVVGDPRGDLPKARDEARAVAGLVGVTPLIGGAATVDAVWRRLRDAQVRHAHFACHGIADASDGMQSALLLAPEDDADPGLLTADMLSHANLDGARIVVSACDTGMSEERTAAESFGMFRGLIAAGARSALVSLWKAQDTATYWLVQEFYRRLGEKTAAQALAAAQLWLMTRTAGDILESCDQLLSSADDPALRARVLLDRAGAEIQARDFIAARDTYARIVKGSDPKAAPAEVTRAHHALALLDRRGNLPSHPDYRRRPFEQPVHWAPFVLIGDPR